MLCLYVHYIEVIFSNIITKHLLSYPFVCHLNKVIEDQFMPIALHIAYWYIHSVMVEKPVEIHFYVIPEGAHISFSSLIYEG